MLNKPSEEFVKDGAENVTQKDVQKVIIALKRYKGSSALKVHWRGL